MKNLVIKHNNKKNNKNNHENNTENRDYKNLKKLPWILNVSPKIKCEFKKIGKDIIFTSGKNLQQILCQKIKSKLLPNSQPGVYQLHCSCNGKYIGESKRRVLTQCIEHQQDSMSRKWVIWGYRTYKRMPWTIRLAASENNTHFTIHVRKENSRSARNKQVKNN